MDGSMFELPAATITLQTSAQTERCDHPGRPGDDVLAGTLKSIQRAAGLEKKL